MRRFSGAESMASATRNKSKNSFELFGALTAETVVYITA
jgi:hypothetical protein